MVDKLINEIFSTVFKEFSQSTGFRSQALSQPLEEIRFFTSKKIGAGTKIKTVILLLLNQFDKLVQNQLVCFK